MSNIIDLKNAINEDHQNVRKWFIQKKLTLNLSRINYFLFHPYKQNIVINFHIHLSNNIKMILLTNEFKYLGVLSMKN